MPPLDPEAEYAKLKSQWGICRADELKQRCAAGAGAKHLIDRFIPEQSLVLMVGDSGLGKSPLGYQMATSVAAGVPFLEEAVQQARVLYLDFENGSHDVSHVVSQLSKYL